MIELTDIPTIKERGAPINPNSKFSNLAFDPNVITEEDEKIQAKFSRAIAKSILNPVLSPDIPREYALNPYQGCEQGNTSCATIKGQYQRLGPGLDVEFKTLIKGNAVDLLRKKLSNPTWKATPIMLSSNTDCYQPIEGEMELTRELLKVLWEFRHPVQIITKNSLILRDLDILRNMAMHNLVKVTISLNTLDDRLRQKLEPKASSVFSRLRTVKHLSSEGIPVSVLAAPIIPGLNDHEIISLVRSVASHGANDINYILLRMNGDVRDIFVDWLSRFYPHKYDKVISQIINGADGKLSNSKYGETMGGNGNYAETIREQFRIAKKIYFSDSKSKPLDTEQFYLRRNPQLSLF